MPFILDSCAGPAVMATAMLRSLLAALQVARITLQHDSAAGSAWELPSTYSLVQ